MLNKRLVILIAITLFQVATARSEEAVPETGSPSAAQTETEIKPPELPRHRFIYLGGLIGVPYSTSSAVSGNSWGIGYGIAAGVRPVNLFSVGGFYNEQAALSLFDVNSAKRYGVEADIFLPTSDTWSLSLGYRYGVASAVGASLFLYGNNFTGTGHGPKLSMVKQVTELFAFGLELAYFTFMNPQYDSVSILGSSTGKSIQYLNVFDANFTFRFYL
ncbi:MAG: hypothetical protein KA715_11420 [Xanthomonadaceae bacterium]|nr:hypothetical protein [Xanthomonadaceae bacterium]